MALILGIETGTDICSVGLSRNDELLALRESTGERDHASQLAVYIDEILRENDFSPSDLDAVAVGQGPGSYTGLRIGVSTAKGLCYALDIPLIAISSIDALAYVAEEDHEAGLLPFVSWDSAFLCPMIDARRMEVYAGVYDSQLNLLEEVDAHIITEESFDRYIKSGNDFVIFGNGASKCADILKYDNVKLADVVPSARGLIKPAYDKFSKGMFEDIAYFEPFYLKDFIVTTSKKKYFQ